MIARGAGTGEEGIWGELFLGRGWVVGGVQVGAEHPGSDRVCFAKAKPLSPRYAGCYLATTVPFPQLAHGCLLACPGVPWSPLSFLF
jgi:hypothetical protein